MSLANTLITSAASIILVALLSGCKSFYPAVGDYALETNQVLITIAPWYNGSIDKNIQGLATWADSDGIRRCTIRLKEYPFYLGHEVRHCFEGHWHIGNNGDDWD